MSSTLKGLVREKLGTRPTRVLRLQNRIPCSIQGEGKENVSLSIDNDAFRTARRDHVHLFDIELDKGGTETAMVRELQWDTFGQVIQHVEFRRVIRGQKTEVEVQLEFTGHPKGGVLNHLLTHVPISCLPSEIPDSIEVFVDALEIGHPLFAKDLVLPKGAELAIDPDTQVAVVATVREEPDEPAEGEDEIEEGATPGEGASEETSDSE